MPLDILQQIVSRSGGTATREGLRSQPLPLYRWRAQQQDLEALKFHARRATRSMTRLEAAAFMLWACDWWARTYDGERLPIERLFRALDVEPLSQLERADLIRRGLTWWGLNVLRLDNGNQAFVGTIALHAGLPYRALERDRARISACIRRIRRRLGQLLQQEGPDAARIRLTQALPQLCEDLPQRLQRQEGRMPLLELAEWLEAHAARLPRALPPTLPDEAAGALDQLLPDWRQTAPLPETSLDAAAEFLLHALTQQPVETETATAGALLIERRLERGTPWKMRAALKLPQTLSALPVSRSIPEDVVFVDLVPEPSLQRQFGRRLAQLQREQHGRWSVRRSSLQSASIPFQQEIQLSIETPSDALALEVEGSAAVEEDLILLTPSEEGGEASWDILVVLSEGSGADRLACLYRSDAWLAPRPEAMGRGWAPLWEEGSLAGWSLIQILAQLTLERPDGTRRELAPMPRPPGRLVLRQPWAGPIQPGRGTRIPLSAGGMPDLQWLTPSWALEDVPRSLIRWRRPHEAGWRSMPALPGPVIFSVALGAIMQGHLRVDVVPSGLGLDMVRQSATTGTLTLTGVQGGQAHATLPQGLTLVHRTMSELHFAWKGVVQADRAELEIGLVWQGALQVPIRVPTPVTTTGFVGRDGIWLAHATEVQLDQLNGVRMRGQAVPIAEVRDPEAGGLHRRIAMIELNGERSLAPLRERFEAELERAETAGAHIRLFLNATAIHVCRFRADFLPASAARPGCVDAGVAEAVIRGAPILHLGRKPVLLERVPDGQGWQLPLEADWTARQPWLIWGHTANGDALRPRILTAPGPDPWDPTVLDLVTIRSQTYRERRLRQWLQDVPDPRDPLWRRLAEHAHGLAAEGLSPKRSDLVKLTLTAPHLALRLLLGAPVDAARTLLGWPGLPCPWTLLPLEIWKRAVAERRQAVDEDPQLRDIVAQVPSALAVLLFGPLAIMDLSPWPALQVLLAQLAHGLVAMPDSFQPGAALLAEPAQAHLQALKGHRESLLHRAIAAQEVPVFNWRGMTPALRMGPPFAEPKVQPILDAPEGAALALLQQRLLPDQAILAAEAARALDPYHFDQIQARVLALCLPAA